MGLLSQVEVGEGNTITRNCVTLHKTGPFPPTTRPAKPEEIPSLGLHRCADESTGTPGAVRATDGGPVPRRALDLQGLRRIISGAGRRRPSHSGWRQ